MTREGATKIRVTELPVGYWTEDFKNAVEAFVEKHANVKSFTNHSTDTKIDFVIAFDGKNAVDAWMAADDDGVTAFETELSLTSNRFLSTTNMHLFDSRGRIRKYDSVGDILEEFYALRLGAYELRKKRLLERMRMDAKTLEQKVRFLDLVISDELRLQARSTGSALDTELDERGFERGADGTFRHLLGMAMSSITVDRKDALDKELAERRESIDVLECTTATQLWLRDLEAVERALSLA